MRETGPTEKILEKHKFCPKTAHSVVQKGKRKMQVLENQALAFYLVPCGLSVFEPIYGRLGTNI